MSGCPPPGMPASGLEAESAESAGGVGVTAGDYRWAVNLLPMPDLVDLRSDTVTQPTPAMRRAMADAVVGDDDYGEDPTVRALEEAFAERVGKPAALFVPSGTMANQIAFRVLAVPGTAVVAGRRQHVVAYEYGAAARNSGVQFHAVDDDDGMIDPAEVIAAREGA